MNTITLPSELAQLILEELYDLRGERNWWQDEPRCRYQERYAALCAEIEELERLLTLHDAAASAPGI